MAKKQQEYGNDSIRQLKGADRVRKRPAVIFGSDGVEGCAHSIFEIISNSIDEARDGHGNRINVTLFPDHVVEVEDFGRGIPVDYNKAEERWNWDLVFCELYAGGKYAEGSGNYDFSLGLNGLPNELKLKYLADNDFADLNGDALADAIKNAIKAKEANLKGQMASEGTTPRRLTDLIGSLCDLTSGSGDKGTPIVLVQNYFNNYAN